MPIPSAGIRVSRMLANDTLALTGAMAHPPPPPLPLSEVGVGEDAGGGGGGGGVGEDGGGGGGGGAGNGLLLEGSSAPSCWIPSLE